MLFRIKGSSIRAKYKKTVKFVEIVKVVTSVFDKRECLVVNSSTNYYSAAEMQLHQILI